MVNSGKTKISFLRGVWLCALLLLSPDQFQKAQKEDNDKLNAMDADAEEEVRHKVVRRAFVSSFFLVLVFAVVGYFAALLAIQLEICASAKLVAWLQVAGACTLLWGTLFVRDWEIQTTGGETLTERVNHWLYRALYCLGRFNSAI